MSKRSLSYHMIVHYGLAAFSFIVIYLWLQSLPLALLAMLFSILLDTDHLFDYWLANGFNLNFKEFIRQTLGPDHYCRKSGKIFVPFHSWELLLLILIVAWAVNLSQLGTAFAAGFIPHLLWDQVTFARRPLMYFFLYRLAKNFDVNYFCYE